MSSSGEAVEYGLNKNPIVWKVSLGGTYDNPVRTECMENNHIRIGWDSYGKDVPDEAKDGRFILDAFMNKMRVGDIVLSCYTASSIDAVGVVTGEYEWHDEYGEYKRVRNVKWIVKGIREDIVDINGGSNMTLSTVYKMRVPVTDVLHIVEKYAGMSLVGNHNEKNYVFIIDEINRGNISKIFGELITLIEETKREGMPEQAAARLPYSGTSFSVPQNVYILGTMNTADRSIALMDTALRRRFAFKEMMPDVEVLRKIHADKVEDLDVALMLEKINERITFLYDREHTIGHAFFTGLKDNPTVEKLAGIFSKSVIPLLQEYFYEDYRKIQLVLGDNGKTEEKYKFIKDTEVVAKNIFKGSVDDVMDLPEKKYEINTEALNKLESYKGIL
ncbi:MAG: AAA family ATPase [Lachnospiraceae bacterium]|nr:AAA family ATPase [Lachnospiraceae bacterium]